MRCERLQQEALAVGLRVDALSSDDQAHLATCEVCSAFLEEQVALVALLDSDEVQPPRPGFDTRFFARLEQAKAKQRSPWRMVLGFGIAAAAAASFLLVGVPATPEAVSDVEVALEQEMLENLELMQRLDEAQEHALLAMIDEEELEALIEQESL